MYKLLLIDVMSLSNIGCLLAEKLFIVALFYVVKVKLHYKLEALFLLYYSQVLTFLFKIVMIIHATGLPGFTSAYRFGS